MAIKATAQYTVSKIYEEYWIVLSNEAHVFRADANNTAIAGNTSIKIYGYQGDTQISTKVGTISGLPSAGMTATISSNNTTNTTITIAVTTALTSSIANNGILTIPITIGTKTINKTFSWSKAQQGAAGTDYWRSTSTINLSDTTTYSEDKWYPVTGTPLSTAAHNRILLSVALNSGTKPSWSTHTAGFSVELDLTVQGSGWGTTNAECIIFADTYNYCSVSPASFQQMTYSSTPVLFLRGGGKYFVKTDYTCTWTPRPDGYTWYSTDKTYSQTVSPSTTRPALNGRNVKGKDGTSITIKSSSITYQTSSSATKAPTGTWTTTIPETDTVNKYLWVKTTVTYSDGTITTTYSVSSTMDSIQVGGRNLLKNTESITLTARNTGGASDNFNFHLYEWTETPKASQQYTVSGYVEFVEGSSDKITIMKGYSPEMGQYNVSFDSQGYFEINWIYNKAPTTQTGILLYAGISGSTRGNGCVFKKVKMEKGNQATDWSPAPEDMATNDQLNTRIDGLDTKLNKDIDAKVNAATDKIINEDGIIDQRIKSTKIEINKETGERMRDLEAYTSRMLLTGNQFSVDISKAKGVNLIQNSVMKQHNERGGSGANSKSIKANFWWNKNLQKEGYLPNVYYGEDSISRTYTDSGNYFRFNFQQANNTTLDYIFSNSIDLKLNSSSIILAYKIKGQNLSSNATFFIGLVFYKKDNSASGLGSVSSANGIPTAYYIPLKEYKSKDLDNSFTQDYIYKTLPITREGTTTFEETLEVITDTDADGSIRKYVQLSATPAASSSNKVFILDPDAKKNVEKSASSDGKVYLDSTDDRLVITVRYYRDLVNFIPLSNPTAETVATKAAEIGPTEIGIFYNSSTKKIWAYNPFTGTYKETSNLFDNTVTDTNIDSVRVIIGVRASNTTAITGQVDISDLKVEYDNASTIWTQKEGEIYTKQYKMDEKGFSISSDTNTMFIDEQEIAAYKRKDGSTEELDTDNPVFQIKEDETILRQTTVYEQLNIENNNTTRNDAFVMKQQLVNNKWYFIFY